MSPLTQGLNYRSACDQDLLTNTTLILFVSLKPGSLPLSVNLFTVPNQITHYSAYPITSTKITSSTVSGGTGFYQHSNIASYASAGIAMIRMSVCHNLVLYQNEQR